MTTPQQIVVGVDGSEGSRRALQWAVDEASLRGATVVAVHAWHVPYVGDAAGMAALAIDATELEKLAGELLDESVAAVGEGVAIERRVERGDPAWSVLRVAKEVGATMLVVGSRGRGGFTGLLLGSVSQQVAHHAPCPVVIVPVR